MGKCINLLNCTPKYYDGPVRLMDDHFGPLYFDGSRDSGYGGYRYDGRWKAIAEACAGRYGLKAGSRVLDLGCAKGFFLVDLLQVVPGVEALGIDVSAYAIVNAHPAVKELVSIGSADDLSAYDDHSFDFVAAMNTLHFLKPSDAERSLREIMRVGKPGKYFVQVDAFTNEVERERLLAWAPIIQTVYSVDEWLRLFKKVGYDGDYWWTFVKPVAATPVAA